MKKVKSRKDNLGRNKLGKDLFQKRGLQTVSKHNIFESYLEPWAKIISNQPYFQDAYYIDAFAGTGKYVKTGEPGSPVIAANILLRCQKPTCKFHCICIEKDPRRFKILQNSLKQFRGKLDIKEYNGEFLHFIDKILRTIDKSPAFFFIDPEGFAGMDFDKIEAILNLPHTELLINFQYNALQRWLKAPRVQKTITNLFGTPEYKKAKKEIDLIELYKRQIRQKDAFVWYFRNKFPGIDRTFYYLVYATKNITGFKIMKDVMFHEQSKRYFEPYLFEQVDFETFQKQIFDRYKGRKSMEYNEALAFVLQETNYVAKDLDRVIKNIGAKKIIRLGQPHNPFLNFPNHNLNSSHSRTLHSSEYKSTLLEVPVTVKKPKINYKEYELMDGTKKLLVSQINDGSIITRFDKTRLPKKPTDAICPHFLELKWAYGCPYDCAWCYLKGTFRFRPDGLKPVIKDLEKVKLHVETFLEEVKEPEILNTGEIADSLMYENGTLPFSRFIIPIFEKQEKHKVLFVTKSNRVGNLLEIRPHRQVIMSFSLNAIPVAEKWEKAPKVLDRIEAAKKLSKENYEIRIRIDPMVPIDNWQRHYKELVDLIFSDFVPQRITIGSLRGLQSTLNGTKHDIWKKYLTETSSWGKKIDFTTRLSMYWEIMSYLEKKYGYHRIALCKETKAMWQKLDMDYGEMKCNCNW